MKKIGIVLILFLIIISGVKTENKFTLLDYFSGEYLVYTSQDSGKDSVDLGFCYVNSKAKDNHVIGESMVIENLEVSSAINQLQARIVKTEYLENGTTVIYAYTSLIDDKVKVFDKNVNLQIAIKDSRAVIGWPLILGSF